MATESQIQKKSEFIHLKGDGDFRSKESIELWNKFNIVVTNPPFII
jgi:predicted RNA methylase